MRLDEPEMSATKQRNYLDKVVKDAEYRRKQVIAFKSDATKKFNKGIINAAERDRIHKNSDKFRLELNDYINTYKFKSKSYKGYGTKRQLGRGVYFYNDAKELFGNKTKEIIMLDFAKFATPGLLLTNSPLVVKPIKMKDLH